MKALVVGGGIAGPATAVALKSVGIEPVLLEAQDGIDPEAGSWLTIAPNGLAALDALDLLEAVQDLGVPTRSNVMLGAKGRRLGLLPIGQPLPDGTPALSFKRTRLAARLTEVAQRRGVEVRTGQRVVGASGTDDEAWVEMADGVRETADLVIGADGIHSAVRRSIAPDSPTGRYVGLVNFGGVTRGTSWADRLEAEAWTFVFGRHAFFGALPTPAGDVVWFVNLPREPVSASERAATTNEQWRAHLVGCAEPDVGPFADLIADGVLELAADNTHDLPTMPRWHRGRVGLVGDALHAPSPSSGQGASMALEDAVVIASALKRAGDPQRAFADFEATRRERVERIVAVGARSSGSKTAGPWTRPFLETGLKFVFRHVVTEKSQAWMYDHRVALPVPGGAGPR